MEIKSWQDFFNLAKDIRKFQKASSKNYALKKECERLEGEFDEAIKIIEQKQKEKFTKQQKELF